MKGVKGKRGSRLVTVRLNALALGVALAGMYLPLVTQSPERLVADAQSMLAGTGATLTASVAPNPYNTLAEQLAAKERALNERETELKTAEEGRQNPSAGEMLGFVSFALSLVLLLLVGINFYLDSRRGKEKFFHIQ